MRKKFCGALVLLVSVVGCVNADYEFERIDREQNITLPFVFAGLEGLRDGESVNANVRFINGADLATLSITLHLGPPAEFRSGTYQLTLGGEMHEGTVDCPSLTYLGGQSSEPSVGGVFLLKDAENRPAYRVRMPPTLMKRAGSR